MLLKPDRSDTTKLAPCNQEEADVVDQGYENVMVKTVDIDVVVMAVENFHRLSVSELWIAFGTGKHGIYMCTI